jgi:hypothetical protein
LAGECRQQSRISLRSIRATAALLLLIFEKSDRSGPGGIYGCQQARDARSKVRQPIAFGTNDDDRYRKGGEVLLK